MTLDSSSLLADVQASYRDNAAYEELASQAMALAFRTACLRLIEMLPQRVVKGQRGEEELELPPLEIYLKMLERVDKWLAANPAGTSGAGARYVDFSGFRG